MVAESLTEPDLIMQIAERINHPDLKKTDPSTQARYILSSLKAIWTAKGTAPRTYLAFNTSRIGIAIRSEKVREIPGCIIRNETRV